MVKYHPDTRFLTDYAAGSLPEAHALCVASHLHYCSTCRARVAELTTVGDVMFQAQSPATVDESLFDAIMGRIETHSPVDARPGDARHSDASTVSSEAAPLPAPVRKLAGGSLGNLRWRQIGKHFRYTLLSGRRDPQETSLFFIGAGGNVPQHRHQGDEITVVLKGSFSDQDDQYHIGDFIVRTRGEKHQPVASQDEDCLCLSTLDAPITMTNWLYRLLVPLLQWRAA